jgi:hypothetical protein
MNSQVSLDGLWESARSLDQTFQPSQIANLPELAQRYLEHAIAPNTPLASAVRLWMHGEIKLKKWYPFTAEQVIHRDRGMIWQATVKIFGGYTIPTRLRVGWYYGSERFESEGEFFRVTVDDAIFR